MAITIDPLSGIRRTSAAQPAAPARPAGWDQLSPRDQRTYLIEANLAEQREAEGRGPARAALPEAFHSWSAVTQREYLLSRGGNR
jgi:hypothetical protein